VGKLVFKGFEARPRSCVRHPKRGGPQRRIQAQASTIVHKADIIQPLLDLEVDRQAEDEPSGNIPSPQNRLKFFDHQGQVNFLGHGLRGAIVWKLPFYPHSHPIPSLLYLLFAVPTKIKEPTAQSHQVAPSRCSRTAAPAPASKSSFSSDFGGRLESFRPSSPNPPPPCFAHAQGVCDVFLAGTHPAIC
jgi:hypothetical protein